MNHLIQETLRKGRRNLQNMMFSDDGGVPEHPATTFMKTLQQISQDDDPNLIRVNLHNIGMIEGSRTISMLSSSSSSSSSTNGGNNHSKQDDADDDEESDDIFLLAKAIRHNETIQELDVSHNLIGSSGIGTLVFEGLIHNNSIKEINLSGNRLRLSGATAIGQWLLSSHCILEVLSLHQNQIGCEGVACLARGLKRAGCCVKELVLTKNQIGPHGAQELGTALRYNKSLVHIDLRHNNIGDLGMTALACALGGESERGGSGDVGTTVMSPSGTTVMSPLSSQNHLQYDHYVDDYDDDDEDDEYEIQSHLCYNTTLEILHVGFNNIGPKGCEALVSSLRHNCSLQVLHMQSNEISNAGLCSIGYGLMGNTALQSLDLTSNTIHHDFDFNALPDCLAICGLEELVLSRNEINDEGAEALATALIHNTRLRKLNLYRNKIGTKGGIALADALRTYNMTVEELDLQYNRVTCTTELNPMKDIRYFTRLNRAGRRLLRCPNLPVSLWALVLSKANYQADVRFYLLREHPDLVKLASTRI